MLNVFILSLEGKPATRNNGSNEGWDLTIGGKLSGDYMAKNASRPGWIQWFACCAINIRL